MSRLRVVKVGGRAQSSPVLAQEIAAAWHAAPRELLLVHGGGDEVSQLQRTLGLTPQFLEGRRITTAADIEVLRMALSGSANKRLVAALRAAGAPALGLSGEDGGLLAATPMDAARYGLVGAAARVEVTLLWTLLDAGYLPVISPLGASCHAAGEALNVNGDDAAAAIAVALAADELLLVSDVAGVRFGEAIAPRLSLADARESIADGSASGGMIAKLQAACTAIQGGVSRVRIGDAGMLERDGAGTAIDAGSSTCGTAAFESHGSHAR